MKETGKDIVNASAMIQQKLPQPEKEMSPPEQQQKQLEETVDKENSSNQSPQRLQISSLDEIPNKDQMAQHRDWMLQQQLQQPHTQQQQHQQQIQQQLQHQQQQQQQKQQHEQLQQQQHIWYQQQQFLQQQQKISQEKSSPEKQIVPQQYPSAPIEFSPTKNTSTTNSAKPTLKDYLDMMKECKSTPKDVYAVMHNLPSMVDEPNKEMENPTPVILESSPDQDKENMNGRNKMSVENVVSKSSSMTPIPDLETVNVNPMVVSQQPKVEQKSTQFYQHSTAASSQIGYFPHHPQQPGFVPPGLSQFPQYHPGMPMYQQHHQYNHPNWQMQNQSHPAAAQNVHLAAAHSPQKQLENRNEAANVPEINSVEKSKQEVPKAKLSENADKELSSNQQQQISQQDVIPSQGKLPQQQQQISKQDQIPSQGQLAQQQQQHHQTQ
jgi:hypothetical protein